LKTSIVRKPPSLYERLEKREKIVLGVEKLLDKLYAHPDTSDYYSKSDKTKLIKNYTDFFTIISGGFSKYLFLILKHFLYLCFEL